MKTCYCGAEMWRGAGPYVTVSFTGRLKNRPNVFGRRQASGYRETCQACGDVAITNEDGKVLHILQDEFA